MTSAMPSLHRIPTPTLLAALLIAVLPLAGCSRSTADKSDAATTAPALDTPRAKVSYMVGLDMAKTMTPVKDEVDLEIAIAAIRDAHAGRKPALDDAQLEVVRRDFGESLRAKHQTATRELARKNGAEAEAFLARNAKAPGVVVTASGLQYQVLKRVTGPRPGANDTVRVHYVSRTLAGQDIESTYAADHPTTIGLAQVFPGWREGVQLMAVGDKYRFWIPPALAYGEQGVPGRIDPNALLVFEVELLEIAGKAARADAGHDAGG